ncbi:MAG TPA: magnesium transporter [Burkholderiales bacterium]|nr:magnesium transporter [Burkholderiales bacterium]
MPKQLAAASAEVMEEQRKGLLAEITQRPAHEAARLLQNRPPEFIAKLLLELNPGTVQELLGEFPRQQLDSILNAAPPEVARQWVRNQSYPEGSIGKLMEPVFAVFKPEHSVAETVDELRHLIKTAFITYGYVTDDAGRLLGIVTMRDLLFADKSQRLEEIMLTEVFFLKPEMPLNEAMKLAVNRHYPVYPVCDEQGRLVGLVRGEIMFQTGAFEISAQPGTMVGVEKEERLATPWPTSLKFRHPWLQFNLLTAFLDAVVVGFFQGTIDKLVILALFLPVLAGQAGNTGCQALAITLRGMTLGELKADRQKVLVVKEAWLGLLNGVFVGFTAGIGMYVAALMQKNPHAIMLGFVVFLAMTGACIAAGLSGALIPMTLKKLGFDPASASAIFLTTATDVTSMGLFLWLATILVRA